jgi:hypothetical protein
MRYLYGLLTIAVIMLLAVFALLIFAINGASQNVPSGFFAIFGVYILLRIAVMLVLTGIAIGLLYWAVKGSAVAADAYRSASPEDKEKLKQSFHDGISILKNIVEMYRDFRKDNKNKKK